MRSGGEWAVLSVIRVGTRYLPVGSGLWSRARAILAKACLAAFVVAAMTSSAQSFDASFGPASTAQNGGFPTVTFNVAVQQP